MTRDEILQQMDDLKQKMDLLDILLDSLPTFMLPVYLTGDKIVDKSGRIVLKQEESRKVDMLYITRALNLFPALKVLLHFYKNNKSVHYDDSKMVEDVLKKLSVDLNDFKGYF